MGLEVLVPAVLLLALFVGPFGVYAFALDRLDSALPAFAAGSALLFALAALLLVASAL